MFDFFHQVLCSNLEDPHWFQFQPENEHLEWKVISILSLLIWIYRLLPSHDYHEATDQLKLNL